MVAAIDRVDGGHSFGGNAIGSIDGLCTYSLQGIVMELCVRAGMDPRTIDANQLAQIQCRGFTVINTYPCYAALQALSQIFLFDPSNYDGVLHFPLRGADAVETITEDDMLLTGDWTQQAEDPEDQTTRADPISIPMKLNLNYYDVSGGMATSLQISERSGDRRATGEQSLQTAVILAANEAKRVVTINHKVMIEDHKAQLQFNLSDKFLKLVVADNVFVQYQGTVRRLRISQADINNGFQTYTLLRDRQSAYTSNLQGMPAYVPTEPPSRITGKTLLEPLDIHIINDRDDSFGCYIAVAGQTKGWVGALVELSLDGGANYIDSFQADFPAIIGALASTLGEHPAEYPDVTNSVLVDLKSIDAELESVDQIGLQNRMNLAIVGNEVLQFGNAAETSHQGTWELSNFLRGRNQTASVVHGVGERFVLLDRDALYFIPAQLAYRNRSITIRATSLNGEIDDVTITTFNFTGQAQVEYQPAYLQARRSVSDAILTWQGVGKLGASVNVAMGAYFVNYRVTLTDGTTTKTFDTTEQSLITPLADFSGPITATVAQRNQLTGLGPAAQVIF